MRSDEEREYTEYVAGRLTRLHRTAYLLCGDAHRADDIVQATVTSLHVKWRRVRAADNIDAYVHSILVRRYLDERRLRWSRVRLGDEPARAIAVEGAEHGIVERDALMTALRTLPKGQRAVVVLRYFDDLSVEATAEALKCSTGNVKSQCARGLAALRAALPPREEAAPPGRSAPPAKPAHPTKAAQLANPASPREAAQLANPASPREAAQLANSTPPREAALPREAAPPRKAPPAGRLPEPRWNPTPQPSGEAAAQQPSDEGTAPESRRRATPQPHDVRAAPQPGEKEAPPHEEGAAPPREVSVTGHEARGRS